MKNKNLVKLVITAILVIGIPSCDPCEGPLISNYKFKGFETAQVERKRNNNWTATTDDSNNIDSLRFRLISTLDYARVLKSTKSNFSFIQSSYACDPVIIEKVNKEIIDFSIFSSNDMNKNYPAGSNLNKLFFVGNYYGASDSLSYCLKRKPNEILLGRQYYYLKQHPDLKGKHSFTFKITLNDTTITKTTEEILIE